MQSRVLEFFHPLVTVALVLKVGRTTSKFSVQQLARQSGLLAEFAAGIIQN